MRYVNTMFDNAKGCKTKKGAEARIKKVYANSVEPEELDKVLFMVVQREDEQWVAVAVLKEETHWMMHYFMDNHICVTN